MLLNDRTKVEEKIKEILITTEIDFDDRFSLVLHLVMDSIIEYKQRQAGQIEAVVRQKITDIIDKKIIENNGVMTRVLSITKEKNVTWYEYNMCNIQLEKIKKQLAEEK